LGNEQIAVCMAAQAGRLRFVGRHHPAHGVLSRNIARPIVSCMAIQPNLLRQQLDHNPYIKISDSKHVGVGLALLAVLVASIDVLHTNSAPLSRPQVRRMPMVLLQAAAASMCSMG